MVKRTIVRTPPPIKKTHRWSGWPGAYCLDCGLYHPLEEAMACKECYVPGPPAPKSDMKLCLWHAAKVRVGCPPTLKEAEECNRLAPQDLQP